MRNLVVLLSCALIATSAFLWKATTDIGELRKELSIREAQLRVKWEKMTGTNAPMVVMHQFPETIGKLIANAPDPNASNILQVLEVVKRLEARVFIQFQQPQPYYWNYTTNDLLGFSNWQRGFNQ